MAGESEGKFGYSHTNKKEAKVVEIDLQQQWRKQIGAPIIQDNEEEEEESDDSDNEVIGKGNTAGLMTLESEDEPRSDDEYYEDPMDEFKDNMDHNDDNNKKLKHERNKTDGFISTDEVNKHDPLDLGDEFILKPDSQIKLTLEKKDKQVLFKYDPDQI